MENQILEVQSSFTFLQRMSTENFKLSDKVDKSVVLWSTKQGTILAVLNAWAPLDQNPTHKLDATLNCFVKANPKFTGYHLLSQGSLLKATLSIHMHQCQYFWNKESLWVNFLLQRYGIFFFFVIFYLFGLGLKVKGIVTKYLRKSDNYYPVDFWFIDGLGLSLWDLRITSPVYYTTTDDHGIDCGT